MLKTELEKLFTENQCRELSWKGPCHDCREETTVIARVEDDGRLTISGGAVYSDDHYWIKCDRCHEQDPVLENYRPSLVYSRVVGYLTPVNGWNPGKKAEFDKRVSFAENG